MMATETNGSCAVTDEHLSSFEQPHTANSRATKDDEPKDSQSPPVISSMEVCSDVVFSSNDKQTSTQMQVVTEHCHSKPLKIPTSQIAVTNRCITVVDITHDSANIMNSEHVKAVDVETPSVQVLFMNTDIGRKYRHEIEKFLHTLMVTENQSRDKDPLPKIQPRPNLTTFAADDANDVIKERCTVLGSIQVYRWFMVDRLGWPMIANMMSQTPGIDIPQYEQVFSEHFPPLEDAEIVEIKPITAKRCFNCAEVGHEIAKCSKPFDPRAVSRNRSKFKASGLQYGRYHKNEGSGARSMVPGQISSQLFAALGQPPDQLPKHIYRMRLLGYPPGWLIEAEAANSGLAMFDKHGREVDLDGDLMEDGQVPEHRMRDESNKKYDAEKLVGFPGFNLPCPEGVEDLALRTRAPMMRPQDSLTVMSATMSCVHETNKTFNNDDDEPSAKRQKLQLDMDLSDDDVQIISSPALGTKMHALAPVEDTIADIDRTLNQLEMEKQRLLAELTNLGAEVPCEETNFSATQAVVPTFYAISSSPQMNSASLNDSAAVSPVIRHRSIHSHPATPIVQQSEYSRLPSYDKFSQGIGEHLPHENLPNATGVSKKLSAVLKNVKDKMSDFKSKRSK